MEMTLQPDPGKPGVDGVHWAVPEPISRSAKEDSEVGGTPRGAVLRLELKARTGDVGTRLTVPDQQQDPAPLATAPPIRDGRMAVERVERLTQVLGRPGGFYSHNRAEVLADAIGALTSEEYSRLLAALEDGLPPAQDPALALPMGQISNLLRSGPAGSVDRGALLLREALDGIGRMELKHLLEQNWKNEGLNSGLEGG